MNLMMKAPAKHCVALRTKDVNKAIRLWGEEKEMTPARIDIVLTRACANWIGTTHLKWSTASAPAEPGRPAGLRAFRRGTGRRSTKHVEWRQHELQWSFEFLKVCAEIWAEQHRSERVPSASFMLYIVTRKRPRDPSTWMHPAPRWAVKPGLLAHAAESPHPIEEFEVEWDDAELSRMADEYLKMRA